MSNSYATVPAIIPGNLQIQGNLYVAGTELRVGATTPYVRLYNYPPSYGYLTVNLQADRATRDDLTQVGMQEIFNINGRQRMFSIFDTAGNIISTDARRVFWLDHTSYTKTGSTTPQTIATKTIYGNQLGANGGIMLLVTGAATTVVGGAVTLFVTWAGVNYIAGQLAASLTNVGYYFTTLILNRNATNAQIVELSGIFQNSPTTQPPATATADTTVNQALAVTTQNTNVSDSVTVQAIEAVFISRVSGI